MSTQTKAQKQLPSDRIVPKILLTKEEAAWAIGISESSIDRMVSEGVLPVVKIRGHAKIDPADLEALKRHKIVKNRG